MLRERKTCCSSNSITRRGRSRDDDIATRDSRLRFFLPVSPVSSVFFERNKKDWQTHAGAKNIASDWSFLKTLRTSRNELQQLRLITTPSEGTLADHPVDIFYFSRVL